MPAEPLSIRKVETRADHQAFFEFPWTRYKDDPNWVPPLLSQRRELLDQEKAAHWEYMEGEYYAAWRGSRIVGTIAAFVNHRHNDYWKEHIAWFGMFEVLDDTEAAHGLLDTATEWARSRGYDALRGPANFTLHDECGLLIQNFSPPVILMPYNPPSYQGYIESAGFEKLMDVYSLYYDRELGARVGFEQRIRKLAERAMKRSDITIRKIDARRKKEEFSLFRDLYNDAWLQNWGFVPMTDRELDALVENLGQFFDPDLAFFALVKGEPAGFALALPNLSEALHRAYPRPGTPELLTLLKALWHWRLRPSIVGSRLPLLGVKSEFRNRGVDLALMLAVFDALDPSRYHYLDSGWVLETNDLMKIMNNLGLESYKTHRFYQKSLR